MENKSHYRKVFKSDHLGIADLEDFIEEKKRLVFTIKEVKQYVMTNDKNSGIVVAGRRISANIAFFKEDIKPLVLNATNSKIVKSFNGGSPFVEDWGNTLVELYIDHSVKMKGEVVGGVRISPKQPSVEKPELTPAMSQWSEAIKYLKGNGTMDGIKRRYTISSKNEKILQDASI